MQACEASTCLHWIQKDTLYSREETCDREMQRYKYIKYLHASGGASAPAQHRFHKRRLGGHHRKLGSTAGHGEARQTRRQAATRALRTNSMHSLAHGVRRRYRGLCSLLCMRIRRCSRDRGLGWCLELQQSIFGGTTWLTGLAIESLRHGAPESSRSASAAAAHSPAPKAPGGWNRDDALSWCLGLLSGSKQNAHAQDSNMHQHHASSPCAAVGSTMSPRTSLETPPGTDGSSEA